MNGFFLRTCAVAPVCLLPFHCNISLTVAWLAGIIVFHFGSAFDQNRKHRRSLSIRRERAGKLQNLDRPGIPEESALSRSMNEGIKHAPLRHLTRRSP
jgi:hypothetical protein